MESQELQYELTERAVALGWGRERVVVIDEDLGLTGSEATNRSGFQRLVAEVGLGHVGVVVGIEVSRLARRMNSLSEHGPDGARPRVRHLRITQSSMKLAG